MSDLRSAFSWSAAGLRFKELTFRAAQGWFRSDGLHTPAAPKTHRPLEMAYRRSKAPTCEPLLARFLPLLENRLDGSLSGQVRYDVTLNDRDTVAQSLKANGETTIQRGVIKDFNLLSQLLLRGSGSSVSAVAKARLPAALIELAKSNDTRFDTLKANFALDKGRFSTDNLIVSTPEYTVTGAGWFALDHSTRWNGLLVLSPRLTQEIQRDFRWIRHLLDRRGRLAIPFRIEGTIPDVKIRIENRNLSQAFRGSEPRDNDRDSNDDRRAQGRKGLASRRPRSLPRPLMEMAMDLQDIYLEIAPEHIAYVKFIFESYEEIGIIRTVDRQKAIIVLLAMTDFVDTAHEIIESLKRDIPLAEISRPADMSDDWFMQELAEAMTSAQK